MKRGVLEPDKKRNQRRQSILTRFICAGRRQTNEHRNRCETSIVILRPATTKIPDQFPQIISKRSPAGDLAIDYIRHLKNMQTFLRNFEYYVLRVGDIIDEVMKEHEKKEKGIQLFKLKQLQILLDGDPFPVLSKLGPLLVEQQGSIWKKVEAAQTKCNSKLKLTRTWKWLTRILSGLAYTAAVVGVVILSAVVPNAAVPIASLAASVITRAEDSLVSLFDRHEKDLEEIQSQMVIIRKGMSTLTENKMEKIAVSTDLEHFKKMLVKAWGNMTAQPNAKEHNGEINPVEDIEESKRYLIGMVRTISEMKNQVDATIITVNMLPGLEPGEHPNGY